MGDFFFAQRCARRAKLGDFPDCVHFCITVYVALRTCYAGPSFFPLQFLIDTNTFSLYPQLCTVHQLVVADRLISKQLLLLLLPLQAAHLIPCM